MGKVQFPLVNIRKDITNKWHLHHIESEILPIPETPDEYGFYTVSFGEIPDNGSSPGASSPKIVGFTEYKGDPVNPKTGRINLSPTQFYVNYTIGQALFHPSRAGENVSVDYYAKGSLVESEEVNYLYGKIKEIEAEQFTPEFTDFKIVNMPRIVEIGEKFPTGLVTPVSTTFKWSIDKPELLKEDSIYITMGNLTLQSNIPTSLTETAIEISQQQMSEVPQELEFKINSSTPTNNPVSKSYTVEWVDRIYFGTSENQEATSQLVKNQPSILLESSSQIQNVEIQIPEDESKYKLIAVPARYAIKKVIDSKTGLEFVLGEPFQTSILNQYGITIPYFVYFTAYKITSAVNLHLELGA